MTADNIDKVVYCLVYALILIVNAAPTSKLPNGFIKCKISDHNFDECLRDEIQRAMPHLSIGIPSLGIHKIDPLRITSLETDQSFEEIVSIKLNFTDVDLYNINHAQITKAHYDPVNYTMDIELRFPQYIMLEGDYEISGHILILPIAGDGKCQINLDLSEGAIINFQMKPVVKNGITYLEVVHSNWKFISTQISLQFDNLLNGDEILGSDLNIFLNNNWQEVLSELKPALEDVFTDVYTKIVQHFLNRIPLNKIFVD